MTNPPEHVDVLVLGSGENGKFLAWHMAGLGHRVAVVERELIGGSCPNTMLAGLPYTGLGDAILAHPTMAEGLTALFFHPPGR